MRTSGRGGNCWAEGDRTGNSRGGNKTHCVGMVGGRTTNRRRDPFPFRPVHVPTTFSRPDLSARAPGKIAPCSIAPGTGTTQLWCSNNHQMPTTRGIVKCVRQPLCSLAYETAIYIPYFYYNSSLVVIAQMAVCCLKVPTPSRSRWVLQVLYEMGHA